jgi:flavin-dependent dehydrogenase
VEVTPNSAPQSSAAIFDLAVIGGGPAGTAAAITAARLGARVALLEAGEFPRQKVCGEFVSPESLDVLRDLLGGQAIAAPALCDAPVIDSTRLFVGGRVVKAPVIPGALSIPRYDLDFLLWQAAIGAGVFAQARCEVLGITGQGPFSLATAAAGILAKRVVIAAGRWSRFKPAIPVPDGPKWIGLKAHFRENRPARSTDLYFFDRGYCGVQPVADNIVNACAMVRSDRAKTLDEVWDLHPRLAERSRNWQPLFNPVSTAPLVYRVPEPVRGNLVFVGDAAAFIDPFVGDGISIALRTGCLAARELLSASQDPKSLSASVARYQCLYDAQFAPLVRAASRIRALLSLPQSVVAAGLPLLRLPGVLPFLIRKTRHVA